MPEEYNPQGKICSQCGTLSPYTEDFCNRCGARLPAETVCPACGDKIPPGEMFCSSCGTPVSTPPPPPVMDVPVYSPPPVPPPSTPVMDRREVAGTPVPGKGPQKFLIPAIIVVVIIAIIAVVVLVGIPGQSKSGMLNSGASTPSATAIPRDFQGDWQVESSATAGEKVIFRVIILPDTTVTVSVPAWPKMQISGTLSNGGSTMKGTYSDTASGESGSFTWVLSDPNHFSGTWILQGHSYPMTGQKGPQVTQVATTYSGSTSVSRTYTTQTTAAQGPAIRAGFSTDKTTGSIPLTVSFSDTSTGSPDQWYWDFGDGTHSTERNPAHTFTTEGSFTVTLRAEKNGQTSSKSLVISTSGLPLTANFVADKTSGTAPLTVTFTDTSTGSPSTWIWELGNGQVSYDRNPEITYQGQGAYTVKLTVEKGGVQSKKSMTINVNPASSVITSVTTAVPKTTTSVVTTTSSIASGSFVGDWTVGTGSLSRFTFNMPVGNSIDGTFGGTNYSTGELKGVLSDGGKTVTGTWKNLLDAQSGSFSFKLTDANHFTGSLSYPGDRIPVQGTRSNLL